jgi:cytochrome P450
MRGTKTEGATQMASISPVAYDPLDAVVQQDPYPFYAALRDESPVCFVESLGGFAVSRYDDVRRVMHDDESFSSAAMAALVSRPVEYTTEADEVMRHPVSIIGLDGADHSRLRRIVNRGFTPRRMAELEGEIRRVAGELVATLVAEGGGDVQAGLAVPLPTTVIAELLGVPAGERDAFRRWSEDMVRAVFEPPAAVDRSDLARSSEQMTSWLDAVIETRSANVGEDLISVLLRAEFDGGALTREELTVFVFTLLIAGSITTAYLIGTATELLATNPNLGTAAQRGVIDLASIVDETLRFDAPVQVMFRTTTRDVQLHSTTIPRGATVAALLGSANRDPRAFPQPDRFDPGRAANDHLTFGHGVHYCLGAALARLEARVALDELFRAATRLEFAGTPERVSSLVFRGPTKLPIRLH